jgi:hypothetical protein
MNNNQKKIDEMREVIAFFEAHPGFPKMHPYPLEINAWATTEDHPIKSVVSLLGNVRKGVVENSFILNGILPCGAKISIWYPRDEVCRRVETTETVVERRLPGGVEMERFEVERRVVRWECPESILAEAS